MPDWLDREFEPEKFDLKGVKGGVRTEFKR